MSDGPSFPELFFFLQADFLCIISQVTSMSYFKMCYVIYIFYFSVYCICIKFRSWPILNYTNKSARLNPWNSQILFFFNQYYYSSSSNYWEILLFFKKIYIYIWNHICVLIMKCWKAKFSKIKGHIHESVSLYFWIVNLSSTWNTPWRFPNRWCEHF